MLRTKIGPNEGLQLIHKGGRCKNELCHTASMMLGKLDRKHSLLENIIPTFSKN